MPWTAINLAVNWTIAIGLVVCFGYFCAWAGVMWDRHRWQPEPCTRKHRDER